MKKKKHFNKLKKEMLENDTLPLKSGATNLVLGEGNLDADVIFIGEGPGYWEDKKGRPFVGAAGKLLDQLLHSIKLKRKKGFTTGDSKDEVFISNVVCYRPPGNRDPGPDEISAFKPYIDRLIEIIKPRIIVTLGRFSMAKFLPGVKISIVHGKPFVVSWQGRSITVFPMYHPAAGLRSSEIKMKIFEDFQKLSQFREEVIKKEAKNVEQISLI